METSFAFQDNGIWIRMSIKKICVFIDICVKLANEYNSVFNLFDDLTYEK